MHCDVCKTVLLAQEEIAPLGHDWTDADCDTPKTCAVCGETEGVALGHDRDAYGKCTVCQRAEAPVGYDGATSTILLHILPAETDQVWIAVYNEADQLIFGVTGTEGTPIVVPADGYAIRVFYLNEQYQPVDASYMLYLPVER